MIIRAWAILLSVGVLASGCTSVRVEEDKIESDTGEVAFEAIKKKNKWGYLLRLSRRGQPVGWLRSRTDGPVVLSDLEPGTYEIALTGRKIERQYVNLKVKGGRRSTVTLNVGTSTPSRVNQALENIGSVLVVIGQGILVAALIAGYLYLCYLDAQTPDNDDC